MGTTTQATLRAVIYTRVSADPGGLGRSVAEQEEECRAVCARQGWPVAEVVEDNDVSASRWSKKDRPGYRRLQEILRPGDVLVCWEASRATRRMGEYAELRDLCVKRGVMWCFSGTLLDPSKPGDRLSSVVVAAFSEHEADQIRERVRRAQRANAQEGKAHGKVPYGYRAVRNPETGRIEQRVPDEAQAPIVREIARRVLDGEPIYAIARDLNDRGVPTPTKAAKGWTAAAVSSMIKRPTYAGLRTHLGVVVGPGQWEPLITTEQHEQILALMGDPRRLTHHGVEPKHLLSGIAVCGVCGGRIRRTRKGRYGRPGPDGVRPRYTYANYVCHDGACVSRQQQLVDALVRELILQRLEKITNVEELAEPGEAEVIEQARAEARALRKRLDDAVAEFAKGDLSAPSLALAEKMLLPQIAAYEQRAQKLVPPEVRRLLGPHARTQWQSMSMVDKRSVVSALVSVTINKAKPSQTFDPTSVSVEWL